MTTSERLMGRMRPTEADLKGLEGEVREAEEGLSRLMILRDVVRDHLARPAEGAGEEAPLAQAPAPPAVRPRPEAARPPKAPPAKPAAAQAGGEAAKVARLLTYGPLSAGELAGRVGLPSGRSLNGVLNGNPKLFRCEGGVWHLTGEGRSLAETGVPAPPNGAPGGSVGAAS